MARGIPQYGGIWAEKSFQSVDINSREELQEIADEEDRTINWELWDKLVEKTKQDIKKELKSYKKPQYINKVFVFSISRQRIIKVFNTPQDCADYYGIARETVNTYMREHKPYYKLMVEFRANI